VFRRIETQGAAAGSMNSLLVLATLNLALGGLVFLLGVLVLRENPRQRLNQVVSLMMFFGGFGALLTALALLPGRGVAVGTQTHQVEHYAYLWEFFFPTLFLFASIFPQEHGFLRNWRRRPRALRWIPSFAWLVYLPHAAHFVMLFLASGVSPALHVSKFGGLKLVAPLLSLLALVLDLFLSVHQALFSLVNLAFGVAAITLLIDSYRRSRMPRLRQQLRAIGLGLTACLALYSLGSLIPTLVDFRISTWTRSLLTAAALTVGSGSIAFAIVRYKFLDAKLLARRGILYSAATALLVGLYLLVVVQLNRLLSGVSNLDPRVIEPVFLVFALVAFQPALSALENMLDRVLLRDPGDHRAVLRNLGREVMTTLELETLLTSAIRTIAESLLLKRAFIVALPREGVIVRVGAGDAIPVEDQARLRDCLCRLPIDEETIRLGELPESPDSPARELLVDRLRLSLAIPLRWRGEMVGGLLLGDKITGTQFTAEDVSLLSALAGQMSVSLQNALLVRDRVSVARIEEEMRLARQIQRSFLIQEFPAMDRFEVHAINIPSKEVGGDLYDLVPLVAGGFVLAVADVAGKGVPAALLSSMLQASLRTQVASVPSVAEILRNINSLVYRGTAVHQFATFFIARVDARGRMTFSNAGHNYPVVGRRGGGDLLLDQGGLVLGIMEAVEYGEESIQLETGDRLVLYTDGITEAANAEQELFGEERLREVLRSLPSEVPARQVADRIFEALGEFLGGMEARDDQTLMVIRMVEPAISPLMSEGEDLFEVAREI
jgi:serine phosphatase RsbU (regulator of sigma subunit)